MTKTDYNALKKDELVEEIVSKDKTIEALENKLVSMDEDMLSMRKEHEERKKNYSKNEVEISELKKVIKQYEERMELLTNAVQAYADGYSRAKYSNNAIIKSIQGTADLSSELFVLSEEKINNALNKLNGSDK